MAATEAALKHLAELAEQGAKAKPAAKKAAPKKAAPKKTTKK